MLLLYSHSKYSNNKINLPSGVKASENMMQFDLERAMSYKEKFQQVAEKTGIDPAIIAAMTSRLGKPGEIKRETEGPRDAWKK